VACFSIKVPKLPAHRSPAYETGRLSEGGSKEGTLVRMQPNRSGFVLRTSLLVVFVIGTLGFPATGGAKTVEELRSELKEKRAALQDAESRITKFKEDIQIKKREARTLKDQIGLIDESIDEVELSLSRTLLEIEKTELEVEEVADEIEVREAESRQQKARLAQYIRSLNDVDRQSSITVFLKYQSFAEAVQEAGVLEKLQHRGQETLVAIQLLRAELEAKRRDLVDFKDTLDSLRNRQETEQGRLTTQHESKSRILALTNEQESQYQDLLQEAQATHQESEREIRSLDELIREELRRQGIGELPSVGIMDWPITAEFGVSCEFHCSGYPYAYLIGPHSGMDIPAGVGTPVKAPADGYVARVRDSGGPGYNYLLLIHGDNVSTVFGHLSGFAVSEGQLITRGTVIGFTGGALGMNGAGLSTGPHLHFEVRENNRAVNARKYL